MIALRLLGLFGLFLITYGIIAVVTGHWHTYPGRGTSGPVDWHGWRAYKAGLISLASGIIFLAATIFAMRKGWVADGYDEQ